MILHMRRDVRVVEGARLESVCRGNSTVGSNPTLSAIPQAECFRRTPHRLASARVRDPRVRNARRKNSAAARRVALIGMPRARGNRFGWHRENIPAPPVWYGSEPRVPAAGSNATVSPTRIRRSMLLCATAGQAIRITARPAGSFPPPPWSLNSGALDRSTSGSTRSCCCLTRIEPRPGWPGTWPIGEQRCRSALRPRGQSYRYPSRSRRYFA